MSMDIEKNKTGNPLNTLTAAEYALGNILVADGQITRRQLEAALCSQVETGRRIGEELIAAGHVSKSQVEGGLLLQRKLIAYAMAAAAGLTPLLMTSAQAGQTSTTMPVSVQVIANARMTSTFQAQQLSISAADIARGYVSVAAAARFSVITNSRTGYLVELYPVGNLFESVQISGMGSAVQLGADGGAIVQRGTPPSHQTHELSFRFSLRPDVLAGSYPWPLQLSVRALK